MNNYTGEITAIEHDNHLSLVMIRVGETIFSSVVIDTHDTSAYLRTGKRIQVLFKETEVLIGKNIPEDSISLQNKMRGNITKIETGKLLSRLEINTAAGRVVSVITTHAVQQMQLMEGDEVTAMVKTNEIMLAE